jgi:DNA-binding MarR family transcriptional regulator
MTKAASKPSALDSSPTYLIGTLATRLVAEGSRMTRRIGGLGFAEWRIIKTLSVEPGATAQRVCQINSVDKGAASRGMKLLEDRGLIAPTPETAAKRSRGYVLTPDGAALNDALTPFFDAQRERLYAGFEPEEVALLAELLQRVRANLAEDEPGVGRRK